MIGQTILFIKIIWVIYMTKNKKTLTIPIKNIYNEQAENFTTLLTQGIKKIDLYKLQKRLVIEQKEETSNV